MTSRCSPATAHSTTASAIDSRSTRPTCARPIAVRTVLTSCSMQATLAALLVNPSVEPAPPVEQPLDLRVLTHRNLACWDVPELDLDRRRPRQLVPGHA